jgi:hypothetical protein
MRFLDLLAQVLDNSIVFITFMLDHHLQRGAKRLVHLSDKNLSQLVIRCAIFELGCHFDTARPLNVKARFLVASTNITNGFEYTRSRSPACSPSLGLLDSVTLAVMLLTEIVQSNMNILCKYRSETRGPCIEAGFCRVSCEGIC